MNEISLLVHTNSDYFDVMDIFSETFNKYYKQNIKKHILTNKTYKELEYKNIIYNNDTVYSDRLLLALNEIEENYILYMHEDMFLYDFADTDRLKNIKNILEENNIDFIKLIKTGNDNLISTNFDEELFCFTESSNTIFSVQPTVWKKTSFIKFLTNQNKSIWELEQDCQQECFKQFIGYYVFDSSCKKRGQYHWDSKIFPYIATAIVKGKWNFKEYKEELLKTCGNNFNFSSRGFFV